MPVLTPMMPQAVPGHRNAPEWERAPGVPMNAPDNFAGYNTTGMGRGIRKADGTGIDKPMSRPVLQEGYQKPAEPTRR